MTTLFCFDFNDLLKEAQIRWLKPAEVLFILQNHEKHQLTQEPPQKPTSGSLFLFNKRVLRFFRKDGHSWRKKKDGRTVGEAHERLKVGTVETINCYYAHGEQNPSFQRRSYWMLDPAYDHIVLVHYRETSEGRYSPGSNSLLSSGSTQIQSPSSYNSQIPGSASAVSELYDSPQNVCSPGSVEVSSEVVMKSNVREHLDRINGIGDFSNSSELEVSQALRRLEEQLSLNDDSLEAIDAFQSQNENMNGLETLEYERKMSKQDQQAVLLSGPEYTVHDQHYTGYAGYSTDDLMLPQDAGDNREHYHHQSTVEGRDTLSWEEIMEFCKSSSGVDSKEKHKSYGNERPLSSSGRGAAEKQLNSHWLNVDGTNSESSSILLPSEVENLNFPEYKTNTHAVNSDYYRMLFDEGQIEVPIESDPSLTLAQKQRFTIHEISPEWGFSSETTKVIIAGSFLCHPSECAWTCMFGDIEVPVQIIQEGVICCQAPPHPPGKVTLCITSGNRESCSEVREFEYHAKTSSCTHCNLSQTEATKSPEELLLLARFVQMLLFDPLMHRRDGIESGIDLLIKSKADEDSWDCIIEALLFGSGTSSSTVDWLLQELLKDKLHQWLSSRSLEGCESFGCSLSKKEQGMIHMIAGLGFEWALNPILNTGVSINFRDINGWTALHWAARFGREKMVAALIASGASAGAVTDPSPRDPTGKTAASIASTSGHKGLAGYLSEVAVTSHLSSLTLEESELSKGSAEVEAEITVNSISKGGLAASEDQIPLKDALAAVRNTTQAAARIQAAFRAHSFRQKQQREADAPYVDEYGISSDDIQELSAMSKLAFRNSAALSIQKKYRGWKGRKDFLTLRQKVVKIQAHVRGYNVRKNYKVICWAVGILDKVILRWRRRGAGLRGFRPESEPIDENEDEDMLKAFRRQKVDGAINEAVSRVLSMVESPEAREQYHRVLERFHQAKFLQAELGIGGTGSETSTSIDDVLKTSKSIGDVFDMDDDDIFQFP
ncbi:hypothetical protein PVL29_001381 [Vitis rotundifolia]|uniref:CG-1 domain-containing protein n=1 Tax=Vitis rotundifolia TaxID=103349 RepID=A0AA39ALH5_VITRO|nr:hypothetical protein PVL29_001381 [Vitis rotundifolia]